MSVSYLLFDNNRKHSIKHVVCINVSYAVTKPG